MPDPDKKQLEQDLNEICRLTDSYWARYSELCEYDKDGKPLHMQKFLKDMRQFLGESAELQLLDNDIIVMTPGGGYDFNFSEETLACGGDTYRQLGEDLNKNLLFFFDNSSSYDHAVAYHEAAHALQSKFGVFTDNDLNKVYKFCSNGLGNLPKDKRLPCLFVDAWSYRVYLEEAHANVFANACLVLNAKNDADFKQLCQRAILVSASESVRSLKDKNMDYPSAKYYFDFPVQKAMMHRLRQAKKDGKLADYYNENGQIDFIFLAKDVANVVWQRALSPRTFLHLLREERKTPCYDFENNWHDDLLQMRFIKAVCRPWFKADTKKSVARSISLMKMQERIPAYTYERLPEIDDEARLLNIICSIDTAWRSLNNGLKSLGLSAEDYPELNPALIVKHRYIPQVLLHAAYEKITDDLSYDFNNGYVSSLLDLYREDMNKIDFAAADKTDICAVLENMHVPSLQQGIWQCYEQKMAELGSKTMLATLVDSCQKISASEPQPEEHNLYYQTKKSLIKLGGAKNTPQEAFRREIEDVMRDNPEKLADLLWRGEMRKRYLSLNPKLKDANSKPEDVLRHSLDDIYFSYYSDPAKFRQMASKRFTKPLPKPRLNKGRER